MLYLYARVRNGLSSANGFSRCALMCLALVAACFGTATAQPLSGTVNIGGVGDPYATIESAISALNLNGVSGPVTFRIEGGTITPPATGYVLSAVTSMSSTNTVTFKPKAGATVTIDGSIAVPILNINGGDYYVIDGTNGTGTSRDLKIINRNTSNAAVQLINGATYNTIKYVNAMGAATSTTVGVIRVATSTVAGVGNSYNVIASNTVGDSSGNVRASTALYATGTSTAVNVGNLVHDNYVVNFNNGSTSGFGIYWQSNNQRTRISNNRITVPIKGTTTGGSEAIRFDNSSNNLEDTIASNRMWNFTTGSTTGTFRGINVWFLGVASPLYIFNNMVSIVTSSANIAAGMYIDPGSLSTVNAHNNSIYIGGSGAGTALSYAVWQSSNVSLRLHNNVLVNQRTGTGVNTNRAIYRSSTSNTLTSNNNLFFIGTTTSNGHVYNAGTSYNTLAGWQGLGYDLASLEGDPQYIDATNGDLHISSTIATPLESKGSPIAWVTSDIDGDTRHATTPDIGADEGAFVALPSNDIRVTAITVPLNNSIIGAGRAFDPIASVMNGGMNTQTGVAIRMRIRNASNAIVYEDVQSTGTLASGAGQTITFAQTGSVSGSTSLAAGMYTMQVTSELTGDENSGNDTQSGSFEGKNPLSGTYTINASAGASATNYTSFTTALNELNLLGVSASVTFNVTGGTYAESLPLTIRTVPGASATSTVTIRPGSGATVVVEGTGTQAVFLLDGADYITLDGANVVGGASQNFTVRNTATTGSAVRLLNGAQYNVVRNMILMGSATSATEGIVHIGSSNAGTGNSYNTIAANTIGDVNGVVRSSTGIYATGSTTAINIGNVYRDNYIVNWLNGSTAGYGIYQQSSNQRVRISGNRLTIPVKGTTTGASEAIRFDNNVNNLEDTISYNQIWNSGSSSSTSVIRGIVNWFLSTASPLYVYNNMISIVSTGSQAVAGLYNDPTVAAMTYAYGNSFYISGSNSASSTSYAVYNSSSGSLTLRNNIIVNERSGTSTSNYAIYRNGTTGTLVSNHNLIWITGSSTNVGYQSSARATLAAWQLLGYDTNSVFAHPPFVNAVDGDLHLSLSAVFLGESAGTPVAVLSDDFDRQTRDAARPDVGADEGNFNGGGVSLQYPNGGEQLPVNYNLGVRYRVTRPLPAVHIEFSSDAGATWSRYLTVSNPSVGDNVSTIATPDTEMSTARVRVISQLNAYEGDTSDASFSLFRPLFTVRAPNGGEQFVPTDTTVIRWTSQFVPTGVGVELQYSSDGGGSWQTIAGDVPSMNLPDTNRFNWTVPNAPGSNTLVRVHIPGSRSVDASNAPFTITEQPNVTLLSLNYGARLFAGEKVNIAWSSVNTSMVRLEYSLDGGASWMNLLGGGKTRLGAALSRYEWTVPRVWSQNALVRIVNDERTRFVDVSSLPFEIVVGDLAVLAPNGGEKYELNQPVTVSFRAPHSERLRLEYSSNGGSQWLLIDASVDASRGSVTFTPPGIPTPRALVRLVDEARVALSDVSDGVFEIMEARSITIFTPSQGEEIMRSTVYPITWQASRVNRVHIEYSATGTAPWQRIASDVPAAQGSYNWSVPSQNTSSGVVRIIEAGGVVMAESGVFSIVTPVTSVRVLRPNGGERYVTGDAITIGWTAANIATVTLEYSSDGGASWWPIPGSFPATQGTYQWTAPESPGTGYRVKVNGGGLNDMSDGNFEIVRRLRPSITVGYPNGGERLAVDSVVTIGWTASDISGPVSVSYSTDNGTSWSEIATADAAAGALGWTVPSTLSEQALVRVTGAGGTLSDVSDATFAIEARVVRTLVLDTPNSASVRWREGDDVTVTWTATNVGDAVSVQLSSDNGATWTTTIAPSTPASAGSVSWRVPHLSDAPLSTLRVRVASLDGVYADTSDASFMYEPAIASIDGVTTGSGGLRVVGAYPNPFVHETELRWHQSVSTDLRLRVYSASGMLVYDAPLGRRDAGSNSARIEASSLPSGVYVYELRSDREASRGVITIAR